MRSVLPDSARRFARALVMPNLQPPVTTTQLALEYRERIVSALPAGEAFRPLMALYLTDETPAAEIAAARSSGVVLAVKLYPAGATTHSAAGVTDLARCRAALEEMQKQGLPLLVHGEVTDPEVDVFDRERVFIDRVLEPLVREMPGLRVVVEHVTTRHAVEFVETAPETVAATITAHHLLLCRNAIFAGGLQPHHYCLPLLKREEDRRALLAAASSGNPRFFLGTDSAPHPRNTKEAPGGCAGIYTAHAAIELYAEAFDSVGALDRLEAFAAFHGADFYGLPRNRKALCLVNESRDVPAEIPLGPQTLVPFRAGGHVEWTLAQS